MPKNNTYESKIRLNGNFMELKDNLALSLFR